MVAVKEITPDAFEQERPWILKNKQCSVVMFGRDTCPYCVEFKPIFQQFAARMNALNAYYFDTKRYKQFLQQLESNEDSEIKIDGVPSIWFFKNGHPTQFEGERTTAQLEQTTCQLCHKDCVCGNKNPSFRTLPKSHLKT